MSSCRKLRVVVFSLSTHKVGALTGLQRFSDSLQQQQTKHAAATAAVVREEKQAQRAVR